MFSPTLIALWLALMIGMNIPILLWLHAGKKQWPMVVAAALVAVGTYGALEACLSFPKPVQWEIRKPSRVQVLDFYVENGEYLHLWLLDDDSRPRYYVMPWSPRVMRLIGNLKGARAGTRNSNGGRYFIKDIGGEEPTVIVDLPKPPPLKPRNQDEH